MSKLLYSLETETYVHCENYVCLLFAKCRHSVNLTHPRDHNGCLCLCLLREFLNCHKLPTVDIRLNSERILSMGEDLGAACIC